jgi:predicted DNA-binding transcriptional regulator YafY
MTKPHRGSRKTLDVLARAAVVYSVLIEHYDATRDELIARVQKALGREAYGIAPEDALLRDVKWLKQLGYEIVLTEGYRYRLVAFDPLLPLPLTREDIETLAAVRKALADTLYGESIEQLVRSLRAFIQPNLRSLLDKEPLLKLNALLLDNIAPQQTTLRLFRRARDQRRQLTFLYTSPAQAVSKPARHTIEPDSMEERDGHVYFEGYSPDLGNVLRYRLDRVEPESVEILPTKFASGRQRRAIPIRYKLSPVVARLGATRRFDKHHEKIVDNGWVEISAETRDLFWASKILLKYGENCIVLEPPELVTEMKRVVTEMARNYGK